MKKIESIEAKEVIVNIRSTGGDVNDALLIYESLSALDAKITTRCYGYTASAATIIAQAASEGCREIATSALYLVHNSSCSVEGNISDLSESIDLLKKTDDRIATLYATRSGGNKEKFRELMEQNGGKGRWLLPEEVIEAGLADSIIGAEDKRQSTSVIDMVKGWFSASKIEDNSYSPTSDINILRMPKNTTASTSIIVLEEGQKGVAESRTASHEDPSLDGAASTRNALAYAEDIRSLKSRG
jgi:ATP-dependent protease ClpP protease subunit